MPPASAPRVSVITPCYNAAPYLAETIASVQAQTFADWEMLIADDASTDNSAGIAAAHAAQDPRIHWLPTEENLGFPGAVRNRAMAAAHGELFAFIDADDLWRPEKLARQVAYLDAHPEVAAVCAWFDLTGAPQVLSAMPGRLKLRAAGPIGRHELMESHPVNTSTAMIRRRCYDSLGGMPETLRIGEDTVYFARIFTGYRMDRMPETLASYRQRPAEAHAEAKAWQETGHAITQALAELGLLSDREWRVRKAVAFFETAREAFFRGEPYRGALMRALATGAAPLRAWAMLPLALVPGALARRLTGTAMQWHNRRRQSAPNART